MVGTSTGTAPYARSRSLISPAWSLVLGTSTRQPNSGRLSHHDSRARLSTAAPTVATTRPLTASRPAVFSATADSFAVTLFCPVPEPPAVTTIGVEADRPPSTSRAAASGSSSAVACSTTVPPVAAAAAASAPRSTSARRSAVSVVPPGAAPTKTTLPAVAPGSFLTRVIACSWFGPRIGPGRVRGCAGSGGGRSSADRHECGGSAVEQLGGEVPAQPGRLAHRTGQRGADAVGTVEGGDGGAQEQLGAVLTLGQLGVGGDGGAAPGLERGERGPLGDDARAGGGVLQRGQQLAGAVVVGPALHGQRPLRRRGQNLQRV